ncbi:hypothetical protein BMR1_01G02080 [Babesia microti strain RI]|uniref:Uncharacterized protein n=1 Tax=Babesia microti (strain RI) TaxID=1133968 RepID=A0A1N6LWV6_BABMR|nr:hypothetical protein BMR1_01G02080 [Babesia microti strain RI]SIO73352.1 hypothetical protein BMR1_01G02080 [Babesia microti strain RI]|eukprot:XP_021337454.1 hypothetical protein BMR1_01G02080 [Babesia microti strain RI]
MEKKLFPIDEVSDERTEKIELKAIKNYENIKEDKYFESQTILSGKWFFQKMIQKGSPHWQYYSGTFTSYSAFKQRRETSKTLNVTKKPESRTSEFFNKFRNRFWSKNRVQCKPNDTNSKLGTGQNNYETIKCPHCYVLYSSKDHIILNDESSCNYFKLYVRNYTLPHNIAFNKSHNNSDNTLTHFGEDVKIIKLFSSNYTRGEFLHIFPDFGWRLLIDNNILTKSIKSVDPVKILSVSFYKESRRMKFSTCLVTLAINIFVRAARIGAKFGLIKLTPLIAKMFPKLEESENVFDEMGPNILYSDSTKLGLFSPQISLSINDTNMFYTAFGLPDYGWRLYKKSTLSNHLQNGCSSRVAKSTRYPNALFYQMQLCDGFITSVDIASYAINMTELLYRLEAWDLSRERTPQSTYNVEILHRGYNECTIKDIDGATYTIIPEEVILNVSTFLQSSFITQPSLLS